LRLGLRGKPEYGLTSRFTANGGDPPGVRSSGGLIYMKCGWRRSQALTVTILKRHERSFAAARQQGDRRARLRRRVHGYVEGCLGARNVATRPGPVEIAQDEIEQDEIA
jgi:hypothetical protein